MEHMCLSCYCFRLAVRHGVICSLGCISLLLTLSSKKVLKTALKAPRLALTAYNAHV